MHTRLRNWEPSLNSSYTQFYSIYFTLALIDDKLSYQKKKNSVEEMTIRKALFASPNKKLI